MFLSFDNLIIRSFSESQTHGAFHNHLTESVQPLIELIDSLRLIGIEKDMDLPSIAVVGDQSSGKSSVLEALSGVALPRGSGKPLNMLSYFSTL